MSLVNLSPAVRKQLERIDYETAIANQGILRGRPGSRFSGGSYLGQISLNGATGTAFDTSGNIWIASEAASEGEAVFKYQTNGTYSGTAIGSPGTASTANGQFTAPQGIFLSTR